MIIKEKLATIIIPHHTAREHLKNLLACIDNSLFDIVICSGSFFSHNANKGAKIAETNKMVILNDDILLSNDDLIKVCDALETTNYVSSSQIQVSKDNVKVYGLGFRMTSSGHCYPKEEENKDVVIIPHGFCVGIKQCDWEKLGGYNEAYRTGYEDVDFGLRAYNLGFSMRILDLEMKHFVAQSEGRAKYVRENQSLLDRTYSNEYIRSLNRKNIIID